MSGLGSVFLCVVIGMLAYKRREDRMSRRAFASAVDELEEQVERRAHGPGGAPPFDPSLSLSRLSFRL